MFLMENGLVGCLRRRFFRIKPKKNKIKIMKKPSVILNLEFLTRANQLKKLLLW